MAACADAPAAVRVRRASRPAAPTARAAPRPRLWCIALSMASFPYTSVPRAVRPRTVAALTKAHDWTHTFAAARRCQWSSRGNSSLAAPGTSQPHSSDEEHRVVRCMTTADALAPECTTRTTPRDMATLLRLIWSDQAGPPQACQRVRQLMSQQLTKHRLAATSPARTRLRQEREPRRYHPQRDWCHRVPGWSRLLRSHLLPGAPALADRCRHQRRHRIRSSRSH